MALGGIYETGTVTIGGDRVSVTGVGTLWSPIVEISDWLFIGGQVGLIGAVVDDTHLTLEAQWQGTLPAASVYVIIKMSWLRYDPALTQAKLRELLEGFAAQGFFYFTPVAPPDPALGEDGQWALKTDEQPWRIWHKEGGIWVEQPPNTAAMPQGAVGFHFEGSGIGAASAFRGFTQGGTGAVVRTWQDKARDIISVLDFGAIGDGVADDTAAIAAAWAACLAMPVMPELVFAEGIYKASVFPNFAVNYAKVTSRGKVTLRYTGTGEAVVLDSGGTATAGTGIYYMTFGRFQIESQYGTTGFRVNGVHHSLIDVDVIRVGSSSQTAVFTQFCVCCEFRIHVSHPVGGAAIGLVIGGDVNHPTCWSTFINTIIEVVQYGIQFENAMGNLLVGGTSEGNYIGVLMDTPSFNNRIVGMDFEGNSTGDVHLHGVSNSMIDCDTGMASGGTFTKLVGVDCEVRGGTHKTITNDGSRSRMLDFTFNKSNDGGVLTDNQSATSIRSNLTNAGAGATLDAFVTWKAFTPTVSAGAGALTASSAFGRYLIVGKTVFFTMTIGIETNGTGSSYLLVGGLPRAGLSGINQPVFGRNTSGPMLQGAITGGSVYFSIVKYDGTYPVISDPTSIIMSGSYEST